MRCATVDFRWRSSGAFVVCAAPPRRLGKKGGANGGAPHPFPRGAPLAQVAPQEASCQPLKGHPGDPACRCKYFYLARARDSGDSRVGGAG
jgi:hypothetical protein